MFIQSSSVRATVRPFYFPQYAGDFTLEMMTFKPILLDVSDGCTAKIHSQCSPLVVATTSRDIRRQTINYSCLPPLSWLLLTQDEETVDPDVKYYLQMVHYQPDVSTCFLFCRLWFIVL